MTAPDVTAGDGLRGEIEAAFCDAWRTLPDDVTVLAAGARIADAVLALPELRALIAERDELRATVGRVRELCDTADEDSAPAYGPMWASEVRRALDGPTT